MQNKEKKETRKIVLEATGILILVALLLVVLGYIYLTKVCGYKFDDLVSDIIGNLIGVLSAFLLFDIIYNQLTQDAYSKETSQQITKTLMGDPETLDAFSDKDKETFILSTIKSMIKDNDAVDVVTNNMTNYLNSAKMNRIRKSFNYTITLSTEMPIEYKDIPGVSDEKYYYVQENLNYEVKYLGGTKANLENKEVKIGFSFDKRSLDAGLLESDADVELSKCIFNENLEVDKEAVKYIKQMYEKDQDEFKDFFEKVFTAVLKIDGKQGNLVSVEVRPSGIVATYYIDYDILKNEHSIRVIFHMPKLWNTIFEVTLVDPTKDPKITFDYIPSKMDVTMYSYLNKGDESNDGAYEQKNGLYDIAIKGEWIYPKSGIVFYVKKI